MANMTPEEITEFLGAPHIAILGTINKDGTPALNPVWFSYEAGTFRVIVPAKSYYGMNIRRDSRITICVQQEQSPYRAVVARGAGVIDIEGAAIGPTLRDFAIHYFGEEAGNTYAETNDGARDILVSLTPDKLASWDYGK